MIDFYCIRSNMGLHLIKGTKSMHVKVFPDQFELKVFESNLVSKTKTLQ